MKIVKQLTLFLDNRPGALARTCEGLAAKHGGVVRGIGSCVEFVLLSRRVALIRAEDGAIVLETILPANAFYAENFTMLFPGGRGQLRLSDPKDPLNTGVEIDAQPLGKKVHRLSLLSGGERSLAALAFLFAVFRARPSPFYVLDEVEAALDDANLRRFLRLVELLRSSAQVIIVTHQQQTMESGDTLYGITMEPGGSSQVVAKRLTDLSV